MFIRILPTTVLQIFCESLLYFQVIFKSVKIADDTFPGNSECEWVRGGRVQNIGGMGAKREESSHLVLQLSTRKVYIPLF